MHVTQGTMLLQVIFFVILLASSGGTPYYITSSDGIIAGNNTCFFEGRPLQPCSTLETLAENYTSISYHNFSENLTLSFLPGNYIVRNNTHLNFKTFKKIVFSSFNGSAIKINCNAEMTITFRNVSLAIVRSLQFYSCGRRGNVIKSFIMHNMTVQMLNSSFTGTQNEASVYNFTLSNIEVELTVNGSDFISNRTFEICASSPVAIRITAFFSNYLNGVLLAHESRHFNNNCLGPIFGACSVALGSSSRCIDCSDKIKKYNFLWLVPLFAVMGLILVLSILFLDLTVSIGLINGLIFYANTLSISGLAKSYNCSIHPLLSVFISWVNLDFGIEACFYSGMDMYQKTWLQFAFPLYIWLLVGLIIILSHYSTRVMRLLGRKVIPVLATLFFLSYAKIWKTIIRVFSFQVLRCDANNTSDELVWTYDGNADYLSGKHIPLFIVALLALVVLFLPYTLFLTFGQCLRSLPRRRGLRWLHTTAFVSIMDAYHAPFSRKHRYWIGFLLLTYVCPQFIFLIVFISHKNSFPPSINMILFTIAIVVMLLLLLKASFKGGIYKYYLANTIENIFLINLGLLAATVYYLEGVNGNNSPKVCACLTASISVALVTFLAIIACHVYFKMKGTLKRFFHKITVARRVKDIQKTLSEDTSTVTTSIVELRETLLETEDVN